MSEPESRSIYDMTMEQIEERLLQIERNKIEFFDEARDGFYISTREGYFIDCNEALAKMLGCRATEEVLNLDLNKHLWANPEDRPLFQSIIEKHGFVQDYQTTFKRMDGRLISVSLTSNVWRDRRGAIGGYRGFVEDRTERKLMNDLLSVSEAKYRHLFDNIPVGVFIADAAGTIIDCNQALCEIVGRTREEFYRMNYYRDLFVNAQDVTDFRRKFTRYGEINNYELQIVRKDGTIRDVSMSGYATRDAAGKIINYQGLISDNTDAKRVRKQLILSERLSAMGRMASQLAHELNNPIYGIMNCLELLNDVVPQAHQKRKFLDAAYNECKRTSGLLIKMLKFFKPDDEQKCPVDINKLLEETLVFYEKQFKDLNVRVVTDLAPDLPTIIAVGSHLKQVFINMIINANTAMPHGGELSLTTRYDPEQSNVVVAIEDTGVGIPPEDLERIFEAFFTTKKEVKGVGLGLSICYGLIKEHGGRIDVASEVRKGTVFTIRFPPLLRSFDTTGGIVYVRRGTIVDVPALAAMYDAFHPEAKDQGLPPSDPEMRRKWVRYMLESGENLLAWQRNEVVAHACLFLSMQQRDAEYLIFVTRRCQHLGIGTRLTEVALARARDLAAKSIWVSVNSSNFEAIRLYAKFGFVFRDDDRSERTMTLTL